jgi:hypothetical protein
MKLKLLGQMMLALLLIPLVGLNAGCGADDPTIPSAPEPAAPKPEEVKTHSVKVQGKQTEYGSHPNYKKAMDRLSK